MQGPRPAAAGRGHQNRFFYSIQVGKSVVNLDDFLLIVCTAILADSVRHHKGTALAALNESRSSHFPVCSSSVSVASRRFILRADRHLLHLLSSLEYVLTQKEHGSVPQTRKLNYTVKPYCLSITFRAAHGHHTQIGRLRTYLRAILMTAAANAAARHCDKEQSGLSL
jgi:hypothetical protein